jgi:hypothetical protein
MFTKDNREENFLTQFGVPWKYTNRVTWDMLTPNWDAINWGRSRPKVEEAILEYAALMEIGSAAPAPILWAKKSGHDVLDGLQRLGAEQLMGATQFSAYLIQTDSSQLARAIRIFANLRLQGGHQDSAQWTLRQAIQLLIVEGQMSVEEVANMGGWKKHAVEKEQMICAWGFAIRKIGGPEQLSKGIIMNIDKSAHMDDLTIAPEPIAEFCNDLKRGRFTNGDSGEYIDDFFDVNRKNRKTLHKQFTKNLLDFHSDPEIEIRLRGRQPKRLTAEVELIRALKAARTASNKAIASHGSIPYMEEAFQIWNQVDKNLKAIEQKSKKVAAKV